MKAQRIIGLLALLTLVAACPDFSNPTDSWCKKNGCPDGGAQSDAGGGAGGGDGGGGGTAGGGGGGGGDDAGADAGGGGGGGTSCTPGDAGEVCGDSVDNDCDGTADNAPECCVGGETRPCWEASVQPWQRDAGVCTARTQTCANSKWPTSCDPTATGPSNEICGDFLDQDCNGTKLCPGELLSPVFLFRGDATARINSAVVMPQGQVAFVGGWSGTRFPGPVTAVQADGIFGRVHRDGGLELLTFKSDGDDEGFAIAASPWNENAVLVTGKIGMGPATIAGVTIPYVAGSGTDSFIAHYTFGVGVNWIIPVGDSGGGSGPQLIHGIAAIDDDIYVGGGCGNTVRIGDAGTACVGPLVPFFAHLKMDGGVRSLVVPSPGSGRVSGVAVDGDAVTVVGNYSGSNTNFLGDVHTSVGEDIFYLRLSRDLQAGRLDGGQRSTILPMAGTQTASGVATAGGKTVIIGNNESPAGEQDIRGCDFSGTLGTSLLILMDGVTCKARWEFSVNASGEVVTPLSVAATPAHFVVGGVTNSRSDITGASWAVRSEDGFLGRFEMSGAATGAQPPPLPGSFFSGQLSDRVGAVALGRHAGGAFVAVGQPPAHIDDGGTQLTDGGVPGQAIFFIPTGW